MLLAVSLIVDFSLFLRAAALNIPWWSGSNLLPVRPWQLFVVDVSEKLSVMVPRVQ
jgi:hypothetical protein